MLTTNIEPILFEGKIATRLLTRIDFYDMQAQRCNLFFKVANDRDGAYYIETWDVPPSVLENWGTDDAVIVQALAENKGFTII
jgi:hypothetical protein